MRLLLGASLAWLLVVAFGELVATTDRIAPSPKVAAILFKDRNPVGVQPASVRKFELVRWVAPDLLPATEEVKVTWTLKSEGAAAPRAAIDQAGVLTVQASAEPGSILSIYADLNHGERVISLPVYIYRPGLEPLMEVRAWHQTAEIPCDGSSDRPVVDGIQELLFDASGRYSVAWHPFESYKDFWGPYAMNVKTRKVTFRALGGNLVPKDIQGDGTFRVVRLRSSVSQVDGSRIHDMQLRLNGIYFGTFGRARRHKPCGLVFAGRLYEP
jgi:hypothetical protein